jgi:HlyD family secretion protein
MFRVKLQLPSEAILPHINRVKTGLRGVGYVRLDESVEWPEFLQKPFPISQLKPSDNSPAPPKAETPAEKPADKPAEQPATGPASPTQP